MGRAPRLLVMAAIAGGGGTMALVAAAPVQPEAWVVPAERALGPLGPLEALTRVPAGGHAPEDVGVDEQGRVVVGVEDGRLLRWTALDAAPEVLANTGGRPLGIDRSHRGTWVVADAERGLLEVTDDGAVRVVSDTVDGRPIRFADDVDVDDRGVAWVSEATDRFDLAVWKLDVLESGGHGRLLRVELASGATTVVAEGLHFANGVAASPDGTFVLVAETSRYRVRRVWVAGERAGTTEVWVDGLPGFPDGVSADGDRFWLTLASPRNPLIDATAQVPWARALMAWLPAALQPAPARWVRLIALDRDGAVLETLASAGDDFAVVTSVQAHGDRLYLGSLHEDAFAWCPRP